MPVIRYPGYSLSRQFGSFDYLRSKLPVRVCVLLGTVRSIILSSGFPLITCVREYDYLRSESCVCDYLRLEEEVALAGGGVPEGIASSGVIQVASVLQFSGASRLAVAE